MSSDVVQIDPSHNAQNIYLEIQLPNGIQINNLCQKINIDISNCTLFKFQCGFMIRINKDDNVNTIKQKLASILNFPNFEWIELSRDNKSLENSSLANFEVGKNYILGMSLKIFFPTKMLVYFKENNINRIII